ncbi:MAG: type II toxin-antitoxin system ParD family antitoxin [Nitriliruptorales bacterium]|nr:type II toxin-antitoxin system ParD family antitoxin [Nitriliruptorales bacterium]
MPSAEKVSVTLTAEMVQAIRASVASGEYASASEVVRDALRGWQRERAEDAERLDAVRARIHRALDDPRPSLSESEVDVELATFFEEAATSGGDGTA